MGCDIHVYVERRQRFTPEELEAMDEQSRKWNTRWDNLSQEFHPMRNYLLFSILAGVRGSIEPLVPPRGLPDDLGWRTEEDAWVRIAYGWEPDGKECTEERAQRWIEYGAATRGSYTPYQSKHKDEDGGWVEIMVGEEHEGKPTHVADPDWHTHSWLTLPELIQCLTLYAEEESWRHEENREEVREEFAKHGRELPAWWRKPAYEVVQRNLMEWRAIVAAMRQMEEDGQETRIVFWFDN